MKDYLNILKQTSQIVQNIARKNFTYLEDKNISQKKDGSFVTDFDLNIDEQLTKELKKYFPDISFISEESQSDTKQQKGLSWCIDPIDGTHNFMFDIPYYAVSVGLLLDGDPILGVIYDPISKDTLSGGNGLGVFLNDISLDEINNSIIIVTERSHLKESKLREKEIIDQILDISDLKYRRFASCALDLMNLVRGRIGAVYIIGNSIWDWSAGTAIALEAGYILERKNTNEFYIASGHLNEILSVVK